MDLRLSGTLTVVDTSAGTVTLKCSARDAAADPVTVVVDAETTVTLNGAAVSLSALESGALVTVTGTQTSTTRTASTVTARTPVKPVSRTGGKRH